MHVIPMRYYPGMQLRHPHRCTLHLGHQPNHNGEMDSCDTFVSIPTVGTCIFGKVSDRPANEPQNLIFVPRARHQQHETVKCTYISIPQVPITNSVILSQPFWMWGAEIGVNEHNVAIGNEAVFTKLTNDRGDAPGLIGMDLLRLGLERGNTARQSLDIICNLLEQYGQNGNCKYDAKFEYDNSFIICDKDEAFVLETADKLWAVERVATGSFRHITNKLSIRKPDFMSPGLIHFVKQQGWWDGQKTEFDWMHAMQDQRLPDVAGRKRAMDREALGQQSIGKVPQTAQEMISILRLHGATPSDCGFCQHGGSGLSASMAAQVSVLGKKVEHYFTVTPRPCESAFKLYKFGEPIPARNLSLNELLTSHNLADFTTRNADSLFWRHELATRHSNKDNSAQSILDLEKQWFAHPVDFASAVQQEMMLYLQEK